jgi:hypothetical protein
MPTAESDSQRRVGETSHFRAFFHITLPGFADSTPAGKDARRPYARRMNMAPVRVSLIIEVEQRGNGLAILTPVPITLIHEHREWRAVCEAPPVESDACGTLDEAILAGARQVNDELQAAVIERPLIAGRITPETVRTLF